MNLSRNSLIFCLTASILMSSSFAQATDSMPAAKLTWPELSLTKKAAIGVLVAMLAKFFATEPHNKPIRYNLDEAKAQLQALFKGENTKENLNELASFAWYFVLDGIIGHAGKRPSLRVDPATQKIDASAGAYSKGLFGTLHDYAKAPLGIVYLVLALKTLLKDLPDALKVVANVLDNPANSDTLITNFATSTK